MSQSSRILNITIYAWILFVFCVVNLFVNDYVVRFVFHLVPLFIYLFCRDESVKRTAIQYAFFVFCLLVCELFAYLIRDLSRVAMDIIIIIEIISLVLVSVIGIVKSFKGKVFVVPLIGKLETVYKFLLEKKVAFVIVYLVMEFVNFTQVPSPSPGTVVEVYPKFEEYCISADTYYNLENYLRYGFNDGIVFVPKGEKVLILQSGIIHISELPVSLVRWNGQALYMPEGCLI